MNGRTKVPLEDKLDILSIVEASPLQKKQVLQMLDMNSVRYFRWQVKYYLDESLEDLRGRYTRQTMRLEDIYRKQIVEIRQNGIIGDFVVGPERIMDSLEEKGIFLSQETIRKVLFQEGLIEERPRNPIHEWKRFEAENPNDMWQTDLMHLFVHGFGYLYLMTILDDFSRRIMHWELSPYATGEFAKEVLEDAIAINGVTPVSVLNDRGIQFYTGEGKKKGKFELFLEEKGIQHVLARVKHPQTMGKIERYHRTLRQECLNHHVFTDPLDARRTMRAYNQEYNRRRKHQGINRVTPEQRYDGSYVKILEERNTLRKKIIHMRRSKFTEEEIQKEIAIEEVLTRVEQACKSQEVMV